MIKRLAIELTLLALIMIILFPVYYIVAISLNPTGSLATDLSFSNLSLVHWRYILGLTYADPSSGELKRSAFPILLWMWNSIKIAGITSVLMVFLSTTSAYALSRYEFRGKKKTLLTLMILQMFPSIMSMVAFYFMLDALGEFFPAFGTDTHGGLILVYLGGTPFNIWLIKGYFDTLPRSIEEAAIMDGCSRFEAFYKIVLPLSTPILAVVALLTFIGTFSDFILPSILLKTQDKLTFAVGIQIFISESFSTRYGQFAAASLMAALPVSALFLSIHRYIISGLSRGGVKG